MNTLKEQLIRCGILPGEPVAMGLPRGLAWVQTMLALIDGGYPLVLLDPSQPPERLKALILASNARIGVGQLPELPCLAPLPYPLKRPELDPHRTIYQVFTSGSTGIPKQVAVTGRWLPTLLEAQVDAFDIHPDSRCLWLLSPAFDASISDVGTALWAGATLVPCPTPRDISELLSFLEEHRITHADLPPALIRLIDPTRLPASLRVVVVGGEPCDPAVLRAWAGVLEARGGRVVVAYGPTETTVCVGMIRVNPLDWDRPYIGAPLPGVGFRVQDTELWVRGDCLARPLQLDPRFVEENGQQWYRTGDQVGTGPHGLYFLGRQDRQIKLRGYRVAPEEIERVLLGVAGVRGAAVDLRENQLYAWVEGDFLQTDLHSRLRQALSTCLPVWMQPRVIEVEKLPRTSSHKVMVSALRVPAAIMDADNRLTRLWAKETGSNSLDLDFFEAGGDSLGALRFLLSARAAGIPLDAEAVMPGRTLGELLNGLAPEPVSVGALRERARRDWPSPSPSQHQDKALLLTGATGFLGTHLLSKLTGPVWCLVRAQNSTQGEERVRAALARYRLPQRDFRVVCGDVGQPGLGMSAEDRAAVSGEVTGVLHGAARVSLVESLASLSPVNGDGVARILELSSRVGWLYYVSTLSIFVGTTLTPGRVGPEDFPEDGALVVGGYAQSKLLAELLVQQSGLPNSIFRLGLLTGSTQTGILPPHDLLSLFLQHLQKALPEWVDPTFEVDMTPVDLAAARILELLPQRPPIAHIAARAGVFATELVELARSQSPGLPRQRSIPGLSAGTNALSLFQRTGWDFSGTLDRPDWLLLQRYLSGVAR